MSAGLAERTRVAIPAALGVAALVPKNDGNVGTLWRRRPRRRGWAWAGCRSAGIGAPLVVKSLVTVGPRELKASGWCGVAQLDAAIVSAPLAEAASGLMACELVAYSLMEYTPACRP